MAITKSFGGSTIRKPGAYSQSSQSNAGGAPPSGNGVLFLVGEASTGAPGSSSGIASYSSAELGQLVQDFTSGPLVDCARVAVNPSKTPNVGGFDSVLVWKTNASTQASFQLQNPTPANLIKVLANKWGLPGNYLTIALAAGTNSSLQRIITLVDTKNNITEVLPQNDAQAQLSVQYIGAGSACVATITGSSENGKTLQVTTTGGSGAESFTLNLISYSMQDLVNYFNLVNGGASFSATLLNTQSGAATMGIELDPVTSAAIKASAVSLYRLQNELVDVINENSQLCTAVKNGIVTGIPATFSAASLTGGATGASTNADFSTGLAKSLAEDYGVVVSCVSQDASADVTQGLTDPSSTYTVAAVLAAVESHVRLREQIKNKKEAQWAGGFRASTKAAVYSQCETTNSELGQIAMQDVLILDENANLTWKPPHVFAAMLAGMRLGTDVGTPLTYKFLNCNGIGHYVNPSTGLPGGDFDPQVDYDPAIDAGVTFAEKVSGGFRVVVDNTTYGKDASFIYNRGSVVEAAQYVAKDLRQLAETLFIGNKLSNGAASSIKSALRNELINLNKANIITASSDGAPQGFVEATFTVTITGNTCSVSVEIKPVQGLDFVLISFTLGDIQQSA